MSESPLDIVSKTIDNILQDESNLYFRLRVAPRSHRPQRSPLASPPPLCQLPPAQRGQARRQDCWRAALPEGGGSSIVISHGAHATRKNELPIVIPHDKAHQCGHGLARDARPLPIGAASDAEKEDTLLHPERCNVRYRRLGHYAMFLGKSNGRLGGYVRNRNRGECQWLHPRHWRPGARRPVVMKATQGEYHGRSRSL